MSKVRQGDVFDFDFGPQSDNRQEGKRPALVVQTDLLNQVDGYLLTIVVPLSTKGRSSPSHVQIEPTAGNGLSATSFAKCEQIYTVPKAALLSKKGAVGPAELFRIKEALRAVLAL